MEETVDIEYLIEHWESIRNVLAPSPDLFPEPEQSARDRVLAEQSLLSSRREYWEVFVVLMSYCQSTGKDPNDVLVDIPFDNIRHRYLPWDTDPFLRYLYEWRVDVEALLPAAYAIRLVLAGESVANRPPNILDVQRCCKKFDCKDTDPRIMESIRKCLTGTDG